MSEITLDDSAAIALVSRPDVLKEFPSFSALKPMKVAKACGRCGRRAAQQSTHLNETLAQRVKMTILGLPNDRKMKLKQLLNASKVTIFFSTNRGSRPYTF